MRTAYTKDELRRDLASRRNNKIIFVPTMGALHEGHASLMRQARAMAGADGYVVVSIFLNPTQFNNALDLAAYPAPLEEDLALCESCGVDLVFTPRPESMYASNRSMHLEETSLSTRLCGASRPGHFAGVCLIVLKLLLLVQPTDAIFGKKDYQQLAILRRMLRDLDVPVIIHGAEIVRAQDGLALSSRNTRLSSEQRADAPSLYKALLMAQSAYAAGKPVKELLEMTCANINAIPMAQIDYVELLDAESLQPLADDESRLALLALAVSFGEVRLIDNIELQVR